MDKMREVWKDIVGYEGLYQVSSEGRIRNVKTGRVLKPYVQVSNQGKYKRLYVTLSKSGIEKHFYIHKLVAYAFPEICGEGFKGAEIDHIDGDATNNSVYNLRFVTHTENMNNPNFKKKKSATDKGKKLTEAQKSAISKSLTNHKLKSKPLLQYDTDGNFIREWPSFCECKRNGYPSAWDCATGRTPTCKDKDGNRFVFVFKEKRAG